MTTYELYSWNINGIRASAKKGLDTWITKTNPDIICFQEVKAEMDQIPASLQELEYNVVVHSAKKKGYSGVATFSKIKPIDVQSKFGDTAIDAEGRIIMTRYPEFILLNIYFPNGKKNADRLTYKMRLYHFVEKLCKDFLKNGEKIILCGDVNTAHKEQDLANPKPNSKYSGFLPEERAWMDGFLELGFIDSFREKHGDGEGNYTWWTMRSKTAKERNVGWRLDYFYVSSNLKDNLTQASIHSDVEGSDHCPIKITLQF